MKSYTDIEQSKKLAKILPLETADMFWLNWHIDLTETKYEVFVIDKSNKYIDFFNSYAVAIDNNQIIPCWSLAALLNLIPYATLSKQYNGKWNCTAYPKEETVTNCENAIDAAFELVVLLKDEETKMEEY